MTTRNPEFDTLQSSDPSRNHSDAHVALGLDMAHTNFNNDYLASFTLFSPLNGTNEQVDARSKLPNLTLVGDNDKHSGKERSNYAVKDAPQGDKPPVSDNQPAQSKELFSHTHTSNKDGGYTEQHFGPRPEDNYVLTKGADGRFLIAAKSGDKPVELDLYNDSDIRLQRAWLRDLADQHIKDPAERSAFAANMTKFEERSKQLEEFYQRQGMSHEVAARKARQEIAKTYDRISFVLEDLGRPESPFGEKERIMIAQQILNHAANPTGIDQGGHLTCNVTTIEVRTYTRQPSEAARLVANVATTGLYIAKDNTHVKIKWDSLAPDDEAKAPHPPDGDRDLASQIFQVTAANIWYQKHDPSVHYEQTRSGERLFRYESDGSRTEVKEGVGLWGWIIGKEGKPERCPSLSGDALLEVGNTITGTKANDWFFKHADVTEDTTVAVNSQRDFETKLAQAKATGKLPIVVVVHTGSEPFYSDGGHGTAGGAGGSSGGWHVVSVTDFHYGPPAKVAIDNQWGSSADHFGKNEITARQLYLSMRNSTNANQLQEFRDAIRDDRKKGTATLTDQLELLRLEKEAGNITDASLQQQLISLIGVGSSRFKQDEKNGSVDPAALDSYLHKLRDATNLLPADKRIEMIERIQNYHSVKGHDFRRNDFLGDWAAYVYRAAWKDYSEDQHNHSLDDDKMNRMQKVMNVYQRLTDRMPPAVADHMHAILIADKK